MQHLASVGGWSGQRGGRTERAAALSAALGRTGDGGWQMGDGPGAKARTKRERLSRDAPNKANLAFSARGAASSCMPLHWREGLQPASESTAATAVDSGGTPMCRQGSGRGYPVNRSIP